MLVFVLFLFSAAFTLDINMDDLDLKAPIAKERSDGYKLPASSFSENSSLESWFVKEKGFETDSKTASEKKAKAKRDPSSRRSPEEIEKRKKRYKEYLRKKRQQKQRRKSK